MSGVIDENGVQWEHCGICRAFVQIERLHYEQPTPQFKYGRDIGACCWQQPDRVVARNVAREAKAHADYLASDRHREIVEQVSRMKFVSVTTIHVDGTRTTENLA